MAVTGTDQMEGVDVTCGWSGSLFCLGMLGAFPSYLKVIFLSRLLDAEGFVQGVVVLHGVAGFV